MMKVTAMYPAGEDATFDLDYYLKTHLALVRQHLGPARIEIDTHVHGPYLVMGHMYFESIEAMEAGLANDAMTLADIPNYTNIEPVFQISRVVT